MIWPFNAYPYTNMHDLNLDWILQRVGDIPATVDTSIRAALNDLQQIAINVASVGVLPGNTGAENAAILNDRNKIPDGAQLYFPAGTYQVSSPVEMHNTMHIVGDGIGATVINFTSAANGFILRPATDRYCTFRASNLSITAPQNAVSMVGGSTNGGCLLFDDIKINGYVDAVDISSCRCQNLSLSVPAEYNPSIVPFSVAMTNNVYGSVSIIGSTIEGVKLDGNQARASLSASTFISPATGIACVIATGFRLGDISACNFIKLSGVTSALVFASSSAAVGGNVTISNCLFDAGDDIATVATCAYCAVFSCNNRFIANSTATLVNSTGNTVYILSLDEASRYTGVTVRKIAFS